MVRKSVGLQTVRVGQVTCSESALDSSLLFMCPQISKLSFFSFHPFLPFRPFHPFLSFHPPPPFLPFLPKAGANPPSRRDFQNAGTLANCQNVKHNLSKGISKVPGASSRALLTTRGKLAPAAGCPGTCRATARTH